MPAWHGLRRREVAVDPRADVGKVAVVAQAEHGEPDGRVDQAPGGRRHREGDVDCFEEVHADLRRSACACPRVEPAELGITPEPAGDAVDPRELVLEQLRRPYQHAAVGDDELRDGAERPGAVEPLDVGAGARRRHQLDPLVTGGGIEVPWVGVDDGLIAPWPLLPLLPPLLPPVLLLPVLLPPLLPLPWLAAT